MELAQKQAFADRISRIGSKGANTCGVVHMGNMSSAPTSHKVTTKDGDAAPTRVSLMSKGLRSAVIQLLVLSICLTLYFRHVGL